MSNPIHQFSPSNTCELSSSRLFLSPFRPDNLSSPASLSNSFTIQQGEANNMIGHEEISPGEKSFVHVPPDNNSSVHVSPDNNSSVHVSPDNNSFDRAGVREGSSDEIKKATIAVTTAPFKIVIETRDMPVKTTLDLLIKYKIMKSDEGLNPGLKNGEPIWLNFRSSEVHDFLDVLAGRKYHLKSSEHVDAIAKILGADLTLIDEEYNKIADLIRETIIIDVYRFFPAGKITDYNRSLILVKEKWGFRGISLGDTINSTIREQLKKYTSVIREYIWKKVNSAGIPLRRPNGSVINVKLITDMDFMRYYLTI
jgi:hypothetical protein